MQKRFTGRHMATIMVLFFGVVIAVNLFMARQAGATFGGVVVENSYVASQNFNRWLDEADAEKALGWSTQASRLPDGRVAMALTGMPDGVAVRARARHPLGQAPDQHLRFGPAKDGMIESVEALPAGRWRLRIEVEADGQRWRTEQDLP